MNKKNRALQDTHNCQIWKKSIGKQKSYDFLIFYKYEKKSPKKYILFFIFLNINYFIYLKEQKKSQIANCIQIPSFILILWIV